MSALSRLLKVGSMAGSMGVYLPAVVFQRLIAVGRVFLFVHLLPPLQYGLWGLGAMLFCVAAPVLTLGSHLALARYVSYYESRGLLERFHRHVRWGVLVVVVATAAVAFALSGPITDLVMGARSAGETVTHRERLVLCWAALINAMLLAWYQNLQSFLLGLRVYRLTSAVEICHTVLFTAAAAAALLVQPSALAILLAHAAATLVALGVGASLVHFAVAQMARMPAWPPPEGGEEQAALPEPGVETAEVTGVMPLSAPAAKDKPSDMRGTLGQILHFGLAALLGSLLWMAAGYVSFYLTSWRLGPEQAGGFYAFLQLGQIIVFLSNGAWAVVFSHVAKRWEGDSRQTAMFVLETAYKAVAVAVMTLTILAYATRGLWVLLLPQAYRASLPLLGGLLMFFQVLTNLALTTLLANLQRRPILIAVAALAGGAFNVLLALCWVPAHATGTVWATWAAWAAGIGMYVGGGLVTAVYLRMARIRLQTSTLLVLASPALLLLLRLPSWWWTAAAIWACLLFAAARTEWIFTRFQKRILASSMHKLVVFWRRKPT